MLTTESTTPAAISSRRSPAPMWLMTSLSAKTVHMELMARGSPFSAMSNSSAMSTPRRFAMISRNFPVPAEHLSFIRKEEAIPFSTVMTLVSCPPRPSPEKKSNVGMILIIFVLAGAAGAAYYYIKFVKGRKPKDEDLDFFDDEGYEEEPYINEDEEPQIAVDGETDGDEQYVTNQ